MGGLAVCAGGHAGRGRHGPGLHRRHAPAPPSPCAPWTGGVPTTEVDLSSVTSARHIPPRWPVRPPARPSPCSWTARGTRPSGPAVVAEAGGIVVALAPTVAGAPLGHGRRTGRHPPVGRPGRERRPTTGITVLRIGDDLPAVTLRHRRPAHRIGRRGGRPWRTPRPGSTPAVRLYAGTVLYAGVAADGVPGDEFCATGVEAPLVRLRRGQPVDRHVGRGVRHPSTPSRGRRAGRTAGLPARRTRAGRDRTRSSAAAGSPTDPSAPGWPTPRRTSVRRVPRCPPSWPGRRPAGRPGARRPGRGGGRCRRAVGGRTGHPALRRPARDSSCG